MEQKHIDDLDESFLGEEFIDEEDVLTAVEANESPAQRKSAVEERFSAKNKAEKERKMQKTAHKAKKEVKKIKTATAAQKSFNSKSVMSHKNTPLRIKVSKENKDKYKEKESLREVPEITIMPVGKSEPKPPLEFAAPPVNPWKEEEKEEKNGAWTQEVSTWKAITGIVVVLLVLSVFTQGFRFSSENGGDLSLQEAQEKTLTYVNSYLLQPPYVAEAKSAEEVGGLYKVTLSVAGEVVDSYLTRDGKLFFPQGFAVADFAVKGKVPEENADVGSEAGNEETPEEVKLAEEKEEQAVASVEETVNQQEVTETDRTDTTSVSLSAKKWIFSPTKMVVPLGKPVALTVTSAQDLAFTFAIPDLDVEQEVEGQTTVTFTPEKTGTFEFLCSSCEDWRGMKGTLVVVE